MTEPRPLRLRADPVPSSLCPACGNCGFFFAPYPAGMRWARCLCVAGASWLSQGLEGTLVNREDWIAVFGSTEYGTVTAKRELKQVGGKAIETLAS